MRKNALGSSPLRTVYMDAEMKSFILVAAFRSAGKYGAYLEYGIPVNINWSDPLTRIRKRKRTGGLSDAYDGGYVMNQTGNRVSIPRCSVEELARQYSGASGSVGPGGPRLLRCTLCPTFFPRTRSVPKTCRSRPLVSYKIFEDPFHKSPYIPGTATPKMIPTAGYALGAMAKADIATSGMCLSRMSGKSFYRESKPTSSIIYNPYPTLQEEVLISSRSLSMRTPPEWMKEKH